MRASVRALLMVSMAVAFWAVDARNSSVAFAAASVAPSVCVSCTVPLAAYAAYAYALSGSPLPLSPASRK